jgi:hypothetical protein
MRRYFGSTDWRVDMTFLLIILFFTAPLFLVAYQLGVYVRDYHYVPRTTEHPLKKESDRAERKREFGQEWGAANCDENFEHALHATGSDSHVQGAVADCILTVRLRVCVRAASLATGSEPSIIFDSNGMPFS